MQGSWLAQSEDQATLELAVMRVMNSSPSLGVESAKKINK